MLTTESGSDVLRLTKDNNKREKTQREAFTKACVDAVEELAGRDANLLVIAIPNPSPSRRS